MQDFASLHCIIAGFFGVEEDFLDDAEVDIVRGFKTYATLADVRFR